MGSVPPIRERGGHGVPSVLWTGHTTCPVLTGYRGPALPNIVSYPPGARCSPSVAAPRPLEAAQKSCPKAASTTKSAADKAARAEKRARSGPRRPPTRQPRRSAAPSARPTASPPPAPQRRRRRRGDRQAGRFVGREGAEKRDGQASSTSRCTPPARSPATFDVAEWSLRRKVALVLAVPVHRRRGLRRPARATPSGRRPTTTRPRASQVTVLGPAIEYLAAAEHAAVVARAVGINDPKLEEAQQEVVATGAKLGRRPRQGAASPPSSWPRSTTSSR